MPQILTLHLVNDLGSDSDSGSQSDVPSNWPGTPVSYDFNNTPQLIQAVWIGVNADGTDNQHYPIGTSLQTILNDGWNRVYQGTEIVGQDGNVEVFSDQYAHVLALLAACCGTGSITAPYALKLSTQSLDPDAGSPPCGAEAMFKWLAVFGTGEARTLDYRFTFSLVPATGGGTLTFQPAAQQSFTQTVQLAKNWPTDFVGMISQDSVTLVGPKAVPGVSERRVSFFDGGTISLVVTIFENDEQIMEATNTWRLPGTICTSGCSTLHWVHNDNVFGLLRIDVNGETLVYSDGPGSGDLLVKVGDVVESTVTGGDAANRLQVQEATDGTLFNTNTPPGPVTFEFTAACPKAYTITGTTLGGE